MVGLSYVDSIGLRGIDKAEVVYINLGSNDFWLCDLLGGHCKGNQLGIRQRYF